MIEVGYQAKSYAPELVTHRYVRQLRAGLFRVVECAAPEKIGAEFGAGPTLREWDTAGEEIPLPIQMGAAAALMAVEWPL